MLFIQLITVGFSLISNNIKFAIQSRLPFQRREAHTCINAFALLNCTHAGTRAYIKDKSVVNGMTTTA